MKRITFRYFLGFIIAVMIVGAISPVKLKAGGISIDAGLTPGEGRLMLRSQMRLLKRDSHPVNPQMEMKAYMFPVMLAYGARSDLTIIARQLFVRREMTMMSRNDKLSGAGDFMLLAKYRLYRINNPNYTIGIAPTVGLEFPLGKNEFSSNSYDLRLGSFFSGRIGRWGIDLDLRYLWNGLKLNSETDIDPGDEIAVETAFARQFSFGPDAALALAPVVELSYLSANADNRDGIKIENTGETVFFVSPGLKLTWNSIIFESLVRFPIWQDQNGLQTENRTNFLIGFRLMN